MREAPFISIHPVYDANNLYRGALAARKGSSWKPEVQRFMWNWLFNITDLQHELMDQTYTDSPGIEFILCERGHRRRIVGKRVRDRTVRHSLCDNVLIPLTNPKLIYANCASQVGKGIDKQRKLLVTHLRRYYHEHGNHGYVLQMDFSKFYDNIRHEDALDLLEEVGLDRYSQWLTANILKTFEVDVSYLSNDEYEHCMNEVFNSIEYFENINVRDLTGEKMMPKSIDIGDQTSQVVSIFYPYKIDNYVKIVRGVRYYGRYMDDSYIIAETREELLDIYAGIKVIADKLGIFINDSKTRIAKLETGFRFLQVMYILTDTGKVIQKINPKRVTGMRRKLKSLAEMVYVGKRDYTDIENMFRGWMSAHHKLMSKKQKQNLYKLFNDLFGSGLEYRNGQYYSRPDPGRWNTNQCDSEREQLYNFSAYQYEDSDRGEPSEFYNRRRGLRGSHLYELLD